MNANTAKALAWDAWAQVLDNRAFRVLCALAALPVLLTFLVGFREDEIVLLFGWKRYDYDDLLVFMDQSFALGSDIRVQVIQFLQLIVGTYVAGTIGILISVVATAFFVPRMTEKGSAETIFSKPVSRFALMMTRFAAGLLFVALLALALNGGMAIGLWLVSDYADATALWSAATLTYTFALIYGVSILAGVVTRNTVAAMLITISFFIFNGCVHSGWEVKERGMAQIASEGVLNEDQDQLLNALEKVLNGLHYALPKTGDSARLTMMLRKSFETAPLSYTDPVSEMGILAVPEGFRGVSVETVEPEAEDTESWALLFAAAHEDGRALEFARRRRVDGLYEDGRRNRESITRVTDERFEERNLALGNGQATQASRSAMGRRPAGFVTWTDRQATAGPVLHEEAYGIKRLSEGDWVMRLLLTTPGAEATAQEPTRSFEEVLGEVGSTRVRHRNGQPADWYGERFRWDAPWNYNPWFSIASSLAFALSMLGLAWWRLLRIDF